MLTTEELEDLRTYLGIKVRGVGQPQTPEAKIRVAEMARLYNEEMMTYQGVADKYGITRERVRQLLAGVKKNDGPRRTPSIVENKKREFEARSAIAQAHPEWTTGRLARELGISRSDIAKYWGGIRHATENKNTRKGGAIEEYISELLYKNGIAHTLTNSRPFDIILADGRTVEIKSRYKPQKNSLGTENFYFFNLLRKGGAMADFYVLVVVNGKRSAFVIPSSDLPQGREYLSVSFCWPQKRGSRGKYIEYLNRFDLLEKGA